MRCKGRMRKPACEQRATGLRIEFGAVGTNHIDGAGERVPIDHDLYQVVVADTTEGTVVQRLGTNVTDAGAARQPGEPAVRDERDVLAPGQIAERRRDLGGLLHSGSRRPHADQDEYVTLAYRSARPVP